MTYTTLLHAGRGAVSAPTCAAGSRRSRPSASTRSTPGSATAGPICGTSTATSRRRALPTSAPPSAEIATLRQELSGALLG